MRIVRAETGIVEWGYLVDDDGRTRAQGSLDMLERIRDGRPALEEDDDAEQRELPESR